MIICVVSDRTTNAARAVTRRLKRRQGPATEHAHAADDALERSSVRGGSRWDAGRGVHQQT
jgi:hypothetical protein